MQIKGVCSNYGGGILPGTRHVGVMSSACSLKLETVGFALLSVRWLPASLKQFLASKTREPLTYGTRKA